MRSVSNVVHDNGGHTEYTCQDGRVLKIKYLTLAIMSKFEKSLENKAIKTITEMKKILDPEDFREVLNGVIEDINRGRFTFGGPVCTDALNTIQGVSTLMGLMCDISPEEAMQILMIEKDGFRNVFDMVVTESLHGNNDDDSGIDDAPTKEQEEERKNG